jgi:YbbR domain-containing protein
MDKLFDSPWMLRIAALFLAGLLFLYIQTESNRQYDNGTSTETDVITNVPLEVYYDDDNLFVTGVPETVDVKISGPTPIVLKTKLEKDFKIFVDLNSLLIGEHSVTIQQENFSEKLDVAIEPRTINIEIEEKVTEEFRVEPEMNKRLVAEDYFVKGTIAEPSHVFITGAKSVIDSISYVKATVTGEKGLNKSFEQETTVKVLDRDLNKLDVRINPEKIKVQVEINEYSRELPLTIKEIGEANEGVTIKKLTMEPSKIAVFGTKSAIDILDHVQVEVDLAKITESGSYEFEVTLPTGATKLSQNKILIHADIISKQVDKEESTDSQVDAETNVDEAEGN